MTTLVINWAKDIIFTAFTHKKMGHKRPIYKEDINPTIGYL